MRRLTNEGLWNETVMLYSLSSYENAKNVPPERGLNAMQQLMMLKTNKARIEA